MPASWRSKRPGKHTSTYCRQKGLFVEQVKTWRQICEDANQRAEKISLDTRKESKNDKQRIHGLERELQRKEKALAEAAALLILRKKLDAFSATAPALLYLLHPCSRTAKPRTYDSAARTRTTSAADR